MKNLMLLAAALLAAPALAADYVLITPVGLTPILVTGTLGENVTGVRVMNGASGSLYCSPDPYVTPNTAPVVISARTAERFGRKELYCVSPAVQSGLNRENVYVLVETQ